jgi:peptide/nickel transport system ATP-binding protein
MDRHHKPQTPVLDVRAWPSPTRRGGRCAGRPGCLLRDPARLAHSIVGESGCGKSTVALASSISWGATARSSTATHLFQGRDLVGRSEAELRRIRGDQIAMVYQDPMQALNPSMRIGDQMAEVLIVHRGMSQVEAEQKCIQMLEPGLHARRGQRDAALSRTSSRAGSSSGSSSPWPCSTIPALLIMDEPTTALDVTVEAAVLDLIADLQRTLTRPSCTSATTWASSPASLTRWV